MPTYPTVYTFLTKNDMVVRVRPLLAEDAPYLVDLFENMSQDSRYSRFLQTLDNIDMERVWSTAEQIAQGVAVNSHGLLAFCDTAERPDVPVAAARYIRLDSGQAEIGISVRDDMQGIGIGSRLMGLLIDDGPRRGHPGDGCRHPEQQRRRLATVARAGLSHHPPPGRLRD
jgi:acetyltransferase